MPRKKTTASQAPKPTETNEVIAGKPITLTAAAANTGGSDLSGMTVTFSHGEVVEGEGYAPDGAKATIESLKPGESVTVTAVYTPTGDDVDTVLNIKTAYSAPGFSGESETGPITVIAEG